MRLSSRLAACALFVWPLFGATTVLFDPSTPTTGPFPSDFLTVADPLQKTGVRINITPPSCASQYTACQEGALLDQYDGFSVRARAAVRFSAAVNTATLTAGVYFVALDNLTAEEVGVQAVGQHMAINQVVYDP
ncbi:MAG TPA: hypothetical protein VML19_17315, partial [Verrucomicrobiae bacterium]|nr:hypothetical protein [Verrucomicrobiae bacterium]